ncbi:MAG: hypothetical protein HFJ28_02710 [Clostridia bacterium]|jgi:hypothetical protein|nr:hypothetical protein [Clostridia bacterium]MCI9177494.1 hypothetical protein [Clostridia bacterium]
MKRQEEERKRSIGEGVISFIANNSLIITLIVSILTIFAIYQMANNNFHQGTIDENDVRQLIKDINALYEVELIEEVTYLRIEEALNTFIRKAWTGEEITKEDVENYNEVIEEINIVNYSAKKLRNGKEYCEGLRWDLKSYLYNKIVAENRMELTQEEYDAFWILYSNCIGENKETYEQFFEYAEKLYSKYVKEDYTELFENGNPMQILRSIS